MLTPPRKSTSRVIWRGRRGVLRKIDDEDEGEGLVSGVRLVLEVNGSKSHSSELTMMNGAAGEVQGPGGEAVSSGG